MELRIFTEPQQGATYEQLLKMARAAEEGGFDAFFRSDHYLHMGDRDPGPGSTDAWITLAGLARETERIRLGTLLTSATFRLPGVLAISVAEVDAMSGGRVELGIGAGWYEEEHRAYGIPFPPVAERFERLEESLAIVTGLWATRRGESFEFAGRHFTLTGGPGLPKPVQRPRPPLIVGGQGRRRTPRLAARFSDEFNVPFASSEDCAELYHLVEAACDEEGRDPASILKSVALVCCVGQDEEEFTRRAAAIGRQPAELRRNGLAGTPSAVLARLTEYEQVGVSRVYLQMLDLDDLEQVELVSKEVLAALS